MHFYFILFIASAGSLFFLLSLSLLKKKHFCIVFCHTNFSSHSWSFLIQLNNAHRICASLLQFYKNNTMKCTKICWCCLIQLFIPFMLSSWESVRKQQFFFRWFFFVNAEINGQHLNFYCLYFDATIYVNV